MYRRVFARQVLGSLFTLPRSLILIRAHPHCVRSLQVLVDHRIAVRRHAHASARSDPRESPPSHPPRASLHVQTASQQPRSQALGPASRCLQYGQQNCTASDGKLGEGLGTRKKAQEARDWLAKTKASSRNSKSVEQRCRVNGGGRARLGSDDEDQQRKQQVKRAKTLSERREEQIEEQNKTAGGARQDRWNGMATLKNCLACSYFPVAVFIPQYFFFTMYYFAVAPTHESLHRRVYREYPPRRTRVDRS